MSAPLQLRLATPADAAALAAFAARAFSDTYAAHNTAADLASYLAEHFSEAIQERQLRDPARRCLLCEHDATLVGYAQLKAGGAPPAVAARAALEVERLYADQAAIGKGVGRALLAGCIALASDLGCDALWLGVWERNPRAVAFYRKHGFVECGKQSFRLGADVQDDLVMRRDLAPLAPNR
jgi:GNAT superfamily N-acetyltransferase